MTISFKLEDQSNLKNHITLLNYKFSKWEYAKKTISKQGYVIARLRFRTSEGSKPLQRGDLYPALTIVSKKMGWKICGEAYEVRGSEKEDDKRLACFELKLPTHDLSAIEVVDILHLKFYTFQKKRERGSFSNQKKAAYS